MAANATFALNAGVWFRRARLLIVSPDSSGTACPLSGRNSTYPPVQISAPSSQFTTLLPTAMRQTVGFLPVSHFRGGSADRGSRAVPFAKSFEIWRATVDEDEHYGVRRGATARPGHSGS